MNELQSDRSLSEFLDAASRQQLLDECRESLEAARNRCIEDTPRLSAFDVTRQLARDYDKIILRVKEAHEQSAGKIFHKDGLALIAQGGYGREQLNLYSDIDLLFLASQLRPLEAAVIKSMLHVLWDSKVTMGQAIRSPTECLDVAGKDLESVTALIDSRLIAGNVELYGSLMQGFSQRLQNDKLDWFLKMKMHNWDARQQRYGKTIFRLEPNVKEAEGGLRDYHSTRWLLFALTGDPSPSRLVTMNLMTLKEHNQLLESIEFLLKIRNYLHRLEGRQSDVLTFERQVQIARELQYRGDAKRLPEERFMRDFYHHANMIYSLTNRVVTELTRRKPTTLTRLYKRFSRRKAGRGFIVENGELQAPGDSEAFLRASTDRLMRVFEISAGERVPLSFELKTTVRKCTGLIDARQFRADHAVKQSFLSVLGTRGWAAPPVREMYECGLLQLYLPEFENLYCLAQLDRYHNYTADEHSIRTLRHSDQLLQGSTPQDTPIFNRLRAIALQLKHWDLLNFALLLHDIGKGGGGGHVIKGAQIAQRIGERIELDEHFLEMVRFLILKHLRLIHTALRRDINDQNVVREFAAEIGDVERLNYLLLLTVCDLCAVSPEAWTEWKGELLLALYERSCNYLKSGSLEQSFPQISVEQLSGPILTQLQSQSAAPNPVIKKKIERQLSNLPERYRNTQSPESIARHFRLFEKLNDKHRIEWELFHPPEAQYSELYVCSVDKPGVFKLICGALLSKKVNILSAQIFSSRDGFAFDIFQITDFNGNAIPAGFNLKRVKNVVNSILAGDAPESELTAALPALPTPPASHLERKAPTILINNSSSSDYTIIEVKTYDRPGVLFHIAQAMHRFGLNIHLALLIPEAFRVVDVFYVTDLEGQKIYKTSDFEALKRILEQEMNHELDLVLQAPPEARGANSN